MSATEFVSLRNDLLSHMLFTRNAEAAYTSRQVADQVHGDFDYGKLEPVIQVSIMNYSLFPQKILCKVHPAG